MSSLVYKILHSLSLIDLTRNHHHHHTHRGESGQNVPWLEKGLQRERNLQLTDRINKIRTNN